MGYNVNASTVWKTKTGITCNPHTFRRTFAVLLRKAGIDYNDD